MRFALLSLVVLWMLSVCAHSAPLPHASWLPPGSGSARTRSVGVAKLVRRVPPTEAIEAAEQTVEKVKDWKRPVVISIGAFGLIQTIGWNYIAIQSFISNRNKYRQALRKAAELKKQPLPQLGDTLCTFETYRTEQEVRSRKPSQFKAPCFQLGPDASSASSGSSSSSGSSASSAAGSASGVSPNVAGTSTIQGRRAADVLPKADERSQRPDSGGLARRGLGSDSMTLGEILEGTARQLESRPLIPPTHASEVTPERWIGLMQLHRSKTEGSSEAGEAGQRLLPRPRLGTLSPSHSLVRLRMETLPGFPRLTPVTSPTPSTSTRLAEMLARQDADDPLKKLPSPSQWSLLAKAKGLKTEDLTFGLTILNTIGSIPSLILTTINAYYYRGNPKVD